MRGAAAAYAAAYASASAAAAYAAYAAADAAYAAYAYAAAAADAAIKENRLKTAQICRDIIITPLNIHKTKAITKPTI